MKNIDFLKEYCAMKIFVYPPLGKGPVLLVPNSILT